MNSKRKLKIAMIGPIAERVPPKKYGGTERVVYALTEELIKRGHKVTLFASGDSKTSATLESIYPMALREAKLRDPHGLNEWTILHLLNAYKKGAAFDLIHDHNSVFGLPIAEFVQTPTVITIHGAISASNRRLFESVTKPHLVTISKSQGKPFQNIKFAANVYNGASFVNYPFKSRQKGYLLFVGRISMEKGVHLAIDAALDLNLPLIIAAKLDVVDIKYFREYIEPRLSDKLIKWVGEVDEKQRNKLMSEAMCMLHPVTWREPFGMTLIEAMACGCPVIAFNNGSIPEVIINGETGFIVEDLEEMVNAILQIKKINRKTCRVHAISNFNSKRMTDSYEELYLKILKKVR